MSLSAFSFASSFSTERRYPNTNRNRYEIDRELKHELEGAILQATPNRTFYNVFGLGEVKQALMETVILPMRFPHHFTGKSKPEKGVLLFGPSYTGKSDLVKAVITELDEVTFFDIAAIDLGAMCKMYGHEKTVKGLFELARDNKPSVIYFDHIEDIFSPNSTLDRSDIRRIKSELMLQLDAYSGYGTPNLNTQIMLLATTSTPWEIDMFVMNRFGKRISIPLPDTNARLQMLKLHIGYDVCDLEEEDYLELSLKTQGFTFVDIGNFVKLAKTYIKEDLLFALSGYTKILQDNHIQQNQSFKDERT